MRVIDDCLIECERWGGNAILAHLVLTFSIVQKFDLDFSFPSFFTLYNFFCSNGSLASECFPSAVNLSILGDADDTVTAAHLFFAVLLVDYVLNVQPSKCLCGQIIQSGLWQ